MNVQQEIAKRAAQYEEDELLKLVGIPKPKERDRLRLRSVIADPTLGVDHSPFPFIKSGTLFAKSLGVVLGIAPEVMDATITQIKQELEEIANRFIPRIFVETHFKRASQPLFALAACEHFRRPNLDEQTLTAYFQTNEAEQIQLIGNFVIEHYDHCKGDLGIWGPIDHYVCTFAPERAWIFRPDGSLERETDATSQSEAKLTLNGKQISL